MLSRRRRTAQAAIRAAVAATEAEDKDCRVLDLGAGAGELTPDSEPNRVIQALLSHRRHDALFELCPVTFREVRTLLLTSETSS